MRSHRRGSCESGHSYTGKGDARQFWRAFAAPFLSPVQHRFCYPVSMSEPVNREIGGIPMPLFLGVPHACAYLPPKQATEMYGIVRTLAPADYERLMDLGFRRSGHIVYRPVCAGCQACIPIRVPVSTFRPSRSQRRVRRRNQDVVVRIDAPRCTDEKARIFQAYLAHQHDDGAMQGDRDSLEGFLYDSPTQTLELEFRVADRLVGVSIVDVTPNAWSSVYFYFDPAEAHRSLGVYSALYEIEESAARGKRFWYIGYYIRDCRRMNYKSGYKPYELLAPDGTWRDPSAADPSGTRSAKAASAPGIRKNTP